MNVETEILKLQERNKKVEKEKTWETSAVRRGCILVLTFCASALFLKISGIDLDHRTFIVSALIPGLAYLISTLTFPWIRNFWEKWS